VRFADQADPEAVLIDDDGFDAFEGLQACARGLQTGRIKGCEGWHGTLSFREFF
jgi:hypothetical protein